MRLIKTQSKQTFKNKEGKEFRPIIYFIEFDNGKKICIKPVYKDQYKALDFMAEYVKNEDVK